MKPVIPQTLNINNLRTTSAKSIKLHTIRKFIKHSLKNARIKVFTVTAFEILLFEDRSVLSPTQQGTGSKRVKVIPHKFRIYFHKRFKNFQSQILEVSLMNRYIIVELKKFFVWFIIFILHSLYSWSFLWWILQTLSMFSQQKSISKGNN